jgi:chemotaxis protein MotB
MSRKKRHHEEEHENHERWLVSYADFITLLFAFFVVMYSVSRVDNKRLNQAAAAIKWALHYSGTGGNNSMPLFEGPVSEGGCIASIGTEPATSLKKTPPLEQIEILRKRIEKKLQPFLLESIAPSSVSVHGPSRGSSRTW